MTFGAPVRPNGVGLKYNYEGLPKEFAVLPLTFLTIPQLQAEISREVLADYAPRKVRAIFERAGARA